MSRAVLILLLLQAFSFPSFAYIPRTETIVKKMSSNNGRRQYKIVREVVIESKERQVKAREVWTVAHGDKMKLEVNSMDAANPWKFAILYSANDRKTLSRDKNLKTFKKSADFFEPLFHDRSHRSLMKRMVAYKFLPEWIKSTNPPTYDKGKTKLTPEPFVHLTPMEGSVNYEIGAASNSDGGNSQTRLWVEQDSFLIKKGRLRSRAEFVNTRFQTFTGGLHLPSEQLINWNDKSAKVKLLTVEKIKTKNNDWALSKETTDSIPSDSLIKEFYSRFR